MVIIIELRLDLGIRGLKLLRGRTLSRDPDSPKFVLNHLKSEFQKVGYSNVSIIQMVGIQFPIEDFSILQFHQIQRTDKMI